MRIPLTKARFIKDELRRKQLNDKKLDKAAKTIVLLKSDLSDANAQISGQQKVIASTQELVTLGDIRFTRAEEAAKQKMVLQKKKATKKAVFVGLVGFLLGILVR